ncbi:MAG: MopE-related protein [Myxococcota bacterium]|nr:MopE-related protein [Myxococcota bacterium]
MLFASLVISCVLVTDKDLDLRTDADGDGFDAFEDCDPNNSTINAKTTWYEDKDQDGYGSDTVSVEECEKPAGSWALEAGDCDDENANVHPAAEEVCDELDNNCDGNTDDVQGDGINGEIFYLDLDEDGYGDENSPLELCSAISGYVADNTDCDDTDSAISPGQEELVADGIDQNCDGIELCYEDLDIDGFGTENTVESSDLLCLDSGSAPSADDCLDSNAAVYPGAAFEESSTACMHDLDGDGYGDPSPPTGAEAGTDCVDSDPSIYPGAPETGADGIDQDCDTYDNCLEDLDGDTYGSTVTIIGTTLDCSAAGESSFSTDCDDDPATGANTHPGAAHFESSEFCMKDDDGDGYGDQNPISNAYPGSDCDDSTTAIRPNRSDIVDDGIDNNCDGLEACYVDADDDGYRSTSTSLTVSSTDLDCDDSGEGASSDPATDCDDDDATINPGAIDTLFLDMDCTTGISDSSLALSDYTLVGEDTTNYSGQHVKSLGDMDGDGLDDIIIGSFGNNQFAGKAYIVFSSSLGSTTSINLADADYSFSASTGFDSFGYAVASAGDVDGDGRDDLLVGATGNSEHISGAGKIYLFLASSLGARTNLTVDDADYSFYGENPADYIGMSFDGAGDIDGDGLDDIIIGTSLNDEVRENAGKAYLIFGGNLALHGNAPRSLSEADFFFFGENANHNAGVSVSGAGDIDGDGLDDVIIGADGALSNTGKAYIVLASSINNNVFANDPTTIFLSEADHTFLGAVEGDRAGKSVSKAGDINGDGITDLLIGASGDQTVPGTTYLIFGGSLTDPTYDLADSDYSFVGEANGDNIGFYVSPGGDIDGDGLDDVLLGSSYNSENSVAAGKAYLVLGSSLGSNSRIHLSDADYSFLGEQSESYAGAFITAGNLNGDGKDDIVVGGFGYDSYTGKTYIIMSEL